MCRDLAPFNLVEKEGFRDFWSIYNQNYKLPCRSTLEIGCLDDLYACCVEKMTTFLRNTPDHATITFDCWSDNAKKRSFIGYTYHFLSQSWEIKTAVLKITALQRPHTGERIKDNFRETLVDFEIAHKKISVVTDGGSDVKKCAELMNLNRAGCISHKIHRLITADMSTDDSMRDIQNLLIKLRAVQRELLFKYDELKALDAERKNKDLIDVLQRFAQMGTFRND